VRQDFPFLIVQLPEYGKNNANGESGWAELREAQWLTAKNVPNTGIAVTMGLGDPANVHPRKKQEVGRRLALLAEKQAYGRDGIDSGPVYKSMKPDGDKIDLSFDNIAGGLQAQGGKLEGFTIAGEDHKFVSADAKIEQDHVIVSASGVSHPVAVRYGWANSPTCTLFNKAGLPTAPFRTDDWPVTSVNAK
jgi:sialate O-acetylesterase